MFTVDLGDISTDEYEELGFWGAIISAIPTLLQTGASVYQSYNTKQSTTAELRRKRRQIEAAKKLERHQLILAQQKIALENQKIAAADTKRMAEQRKALYMQKYNAQRINTQKYTYGGLNTASRSLLAPYTRNISQYRNVRSRTNTKTDNMTKYILLGGGIGLLVLLVIVLTRKK